MPKSSKQKLAYQAAYQNTPEEIKKREARNRARYQAEKKGLVHKGDGKEIDHKKMLDKGGSESMSNTRVVDAAENRGWRGKQPDVYGKKK